MERDLTSGSAAGPGACREVVIVESDEYPAVAAVRIARETLLDRIPVPDGRIHRMEAERDDREAAAREGTWILDPAAASGLDRAREER